MMLFNVEHIILNRILDIWSDLSKGTGHALYGTPQTDSSFNFFSLKKEAWWMIMVKFNR